MCVLMIGRLHVWIVVVVDAVQKKGRKGERGKSGETV